MSRSLFWLSDEAWAAIAPHLPQNQPGARRVDDHRVISGIAHLLKIGCRWADMPLEYGPPTTAYNRWNRWSRRGIWARILSALTEEGWIADRGYDANKLRATLRAQETTPIIPGRCNSKRPIQYDERRYKDRWRIEAMFCRLKDFRRVATRYDKLARNFLSAVHLAAAVAFWL